MEESVKTDSIFNIGVDQESKSLLKTASAWAKIIAVVAFVQVGITLIMAFIGKETTAQLIGAISAAIIVSIISIILNLFMFKFSQKTKEGIDSSNQIVFAEGISNLRNYFKTLGIILIIVISLFIIGVVVAIIFAGVLMQNAPVS